MGTVDAEVGPEEVSRGDGGRDRRGREGVKMQIKIPGSFSSGGQSKEDKREKGKNFNSV